MIEEEVTTYKVGISKEVIKEDMTEDKVFSSGTTKVNGKGEGVFSGPYTLAKWMWAHHKGKTITRFVGEPMWKDYDTMFNEWFLT